MTKKISQRAAVKLRKRVKELETKLEHSKDTLRWGWGTYLDGFVLSDAQFARVKTANLLGHACLIQPSGSGNGVDVKAVKYE